MEKVRNSSILKAICYIMIPILVAIFMLSILHMAFLSEFRNEEEMQYSQTENFANNYLYFLIRKVSECQSNMRMRYFNELEDEEGNLYCYFDGGNIQYNDEIGNCINYIIIERETGEKFTNIRSNNYQEVIDNMKEQKIYWNLVEGKIETNLKYINQENIRYNYSFNHISYHEEAEVETKEFKDYDIYSFYDENETTLANSFLWEKMYMILCYNTKHYLCIVAV